MEADVSKYTDELNRLNKAKEIEDSLGQPMNKPLLAQPGKADDKAEKRGRASDEYRKATMRALRTNFQEISNVLREGSDADGGYLVPEEWDSRLIEELENVSIMRNLATVIPTTSQLNIPVASTQPEAAWVEEGETITFSDAKFGQIMLGAHKLVVAVKVTEELIYDNAYDLEGYLQRKFAYAINRKEEAAFMSGEASANTPTGIFDPTAGGEQYKTLTAALKADDIMDLIYALERPYRPKAGFIMNDKIVASVRKLKDGNGAYMWQPTLIAGEPDRLGGYPLYTSAYAPETGIAFGDYSYYNIGDRGPRSYAKLSELYAENGMVGYIMKERVDGILTLQKAVQILTLQG